MNYKGYRCTNCGKMLKVSTAVDILKCECCGSEYRLDNNGYIQRLYVEHLPFRPATIQCEEIIEGRMLYAGLSPDQIFEVTLGRMARDLSEKILPYMDLNVEYDPMHMNYIMKSKIRMAIPNRDPRQVLMDAMPVEAEGVRLNAIGPR